MPDFLETSAARGVYPHAPRSALVTRHVTRHITTNTKGGGFTCLHTGLPIERQRAALEAEIAADAA